MEAKLKVDVVSLGIVERDGSPRIHYPPGSYEVPDDIAAALREQGVLAPEPTPKAGKASSDGKGKGG